MKKCRFCGLNGDGKTEDIIQSGEILSIKHFRQRNTVKSAAYAVKFNFNESHIKTIEYYVT